MIIQLTLGNPKIKNKEFFFEFNLNFSVLCIKSPRFSVLNFTKFYIYIISLKERKIYKGF